ncbi:O-acetylhomoserine aminocarboxypropyltransferase [Amphritea spongicola]|nr:O-acetylhomoserine aminocarboxypropyltransferase [Aliamphritea spongicola]
MGADTIALHAGYQPEPEHGSRAVPIYQTTSYVFESVDAASALFNVEQGGHIYSRITNPTVAVLEQRVAALEGGTGAVCTASGMSALFVTFVSLCSAGDHIVSAGQIYGSTVTLLKHTLKRFAIDVTFVDINDSQAVAGAIQSNTKLVFCESIGNPGLEVSDLPSISDVAHQHGIPLVVDATFATPSLCRPLEHGADVVVHSLTKWIGGHGTAIGGAIVDGGKFDWAASGRFPTLTEPYEPFHGINFWEEFGPAALTMRIRAEAMRDFGAAMSPHNAFLLLQGIETLNLRMKQHVENARQLTEWLQQQDNVAWVNHPDLESNPTHEIASQLFPNGAGSMLCFGVKGGRACGAAFIDALQLSSNLANVGDARTLVLHPASTTHSRLDDEAMIKAGIGPDMIRVSVGIESIRDICADFSQGLKAADKAWQKQQEA